MVSVSAVSLNELSQMLALGMSESNSVGQKVIPWIVCPSFSMVELKAALETKQVKIHEKTGMQFQRSKKDEG